VKLSAGTLNLTALLYRPTSVRDAATGETSTAFASIGTRRCGLLAIKPVENELESQRGARADAQLVMRLDSVTRAIDATWRIGFQGDTYEVSGIDATIRDGSLLLYLRGTVA
jgi:hypothetical protein